MRGMIDVPPPIRISKPRTCSPSISRTRGMKPPSWMPRDRAVLVGGAEGRLELARHQLADVVAHEVAHVGARVGRGVEQLALADAGPRVTGDVADRVAAALARGQAGVADAAHELLGDRQRHVVHLHVLARRDVALAQRRVLLDGVAEGVHLLGRDAAPRDLDADHLHVGLALAVHALLQAEADELVLGRVAGEELGRLGVEVVELALEDRDHVPRDVLVDLGIGEGPRPAAVPRALVCGLMSGRRLH